jgi:outer membrane protein assembly factor BamE
MLPSRPAFYLALCSLAALSGCQSWFSPVLLDKLTPYKIEVVQGNVVTRERVKALQVGMSRDQVVDILGTPLLTDPFHADRWDYVFTIRRPNAPFVQRSVVLTFEADKLKTIEAPELPDEREFVALIDPYKAPKTTPKLSLSESEKAALPQPKPRANTGAEPIPGPQRSYPPLETP